MTALLWWAVLICCLTVLCARWGFRSSVESGDCECLEGEPECRYCAARRERP